MSATPEVSIRKCLQAPAAEVGNDTDEAHRVDGLGDVLLKASRKGALSVLLASVSRERDGWHARPFGAQPSNERVAVFVWHANVADDHVWFHQRECGARVCCRAGDRNLCAVLAQNLLQERARVQL